jgi:hypothetical protein
MMTEAKNTRQSWQEFLKATISIIKSDADFEDLIFFVQ